METSSGFQPGRPEDLAPRMHTNFLPSNLGTDPLAHLSPAAAERLQTLRDHVADLHALGVPWEDRREATTARLQAEARLRQLRDHPQHGGFNLPPSNRSVIDAEKNLAKLSEDEQRLNKRYETRSAAWHAAGQVLAAVEAYLRDGLPGNVVLEDHKAPEPKLLKNETSLPEAIENRRRRVKELRSELARIRSAPFPSSYSKQKMREQIEALAQAPDITMLVKNDGKITWPTQRLRSQVFNAELPMQAFTETPNALALFVWTFKDALVAKLDAEIDSEADDTAALTHEARQKAEAEVLGDLIETERLETELVFRAQREGFSGVEHRGDCSPLALLSVALRTAPRAGPLPPTSAGMVIDVVRPSGR